MKDGQGAEKTWMGVSGIWFENVKLDVTIRHPSGGSHVLLAISAIHKVSYLLFLWETKWGEPLLTP